MDKRNFLFMFCVTLAFFGVHSYFGNPAPVKVEAPLAKAAPISAPLIAAQNVPLTPPPANETFYVLENEYQQLVFSSRGGSLAEINLPIQGPDHPNSIVKEIDIDRIIQEKSPQNARFPLHAYYTAGNVSHSEGSLGGYYPLLRRSILNPNGSEKSVIPPELYAMSVVTDDYAFPTANFSVTRFDANSIQFQGTVDGRRITKTYTVPKERNGPYCFNLDIQVDGEGRDLLLTSGVPDVEIVGGSYAPLLRYQYTQNRVSDVESMDLPKSGPLQNFSTPINWLSNSNGFFGLILDPLKQLLPGYRTKYVEGTQVPTRLTLVDPGYNLYPAASYPGYAVYLPLKSGVTPFRIFAGPFDNSLLKKLDELYAEPSTNYDPEYDSAQRIQGWFSFISQPFVKFLSLLMKFFYAITHSWAASIILLTIALRAMMYPLNSWSIRSSIKMQEMAPKTKAIQERYKNDPRKAQMEVMNLYRESGINPITGCLPMLLQLPFLMGMFYLLKSSFPLRGAPFIPGWIDDLAAPDILFTWGQPIWFFGNEFHLLPILMGLTMFIQQRMTAKPPQDPKNPTDAEKQQKMMGNVMSIVFVVMFYSFPSGLNLYFMFSTLLGIAQQAWMTKRMKAAK